MFKSLSDILSTQKEPPGPDPEVLRKAAPMTDPKIKSIAGHALHDPWSVTPEQIRELAGSVLAHIARQGR